MIEILLIFITAAVAKFLHYCIGSPVQGEFYTGRIFSFYGNFISKKYNEFETKEHHRVYNNYNAWKHDFDLTLQANLENKSFEETQYIYKDYLLKVQSVYEDIENNKRVNPYSALGACPICFSTWIALIMTFFYIIFVPIAWYWILLIPPTSVILSRYISIK